MAWRPRAVRAGLGVTLAVVALLGVTATTGRDLVSGERWVATAAASPQQAPTDHQGEIFSFGITVPAEPIVAGDSITFPNNSELPHTITDRGGTFDSGEIAPGASDSVTFDTPGRVEIFCQINPSTMNAVVVVEEGDKPLLATRVQLYDEFREGETRRFDPADLVVDAGTEITVANVGGLEHTLTAEDGSFTSGVVAPGEDQGVFAGTNAKLVVDDAGTFEIFCELFPDEMRGTLEVIADVEATTTTTSGDPPPEGDPPEGDEAAAAAGDGDGTDVAALIGVALVFLAGAVAIALALAGGSGKNTPASQAF